MHQTDFNKYEWQMGLQAEPRGHRYRNPMHIIGRVSALRDDAESLIIATSFGRVPFNSWTFLEPRPRK